MTCHPHTQQVWSILYCHSSPPSICIFLCHVVKCDSMRDPSQLCLSSLNCLEQDSLKMLKLLLLADTPQVSHLWASAMMAASWPSRLPTCLNRMRRKMSPMTPSSSEMSLTRKQNQNHETMTTYLHGRSWGWGLSEHSALMQAIPGGFN